MSPWPSDCDGCGECPSMCTCTCWDWAPHAPGVCGATRCLMEDGRAAGRGPAGGVSHARRGGLGGHLVRGGLGRFTGDDVEPLGESRHDDDL